MAINMLWEDKRYLCGDRNLSLLFSFSALNRKADLVLNSVVDPDWFFSDPNPTSQMVSDPA